MKLKSLCTRKEMVTKLKRLQRVEKISASYTSDKRLITRIYSELKKLLQHYSQYLSYGNT
jgi:hypothetical protein